VAGPRLGKSAAKSAFDLQVYLGDRGPVCLRGGGEVTALESGQRDLRGQVSQFQRQFKG
jgi:hypothetical protein